MSKTYTHREVIEAIAAALMFGEDAGLAAKVHDPAQDESVIYPGGGCVVHIAPNAIELLCEALEATELVDLNAKPMRFGITHFDMTQSKPETPGL